MSPSPLGSHNHTQTHLKLSKQLPLQAFVSADLHVEAMSSKVVLMMPKNQESSKIQDSRIKLQESRFKNNQDLDSRIKTRLNQDKY